MILSLSLAALPVVDAGTLLKWTLVASGSSEAETDAAVRRVDGGLAIVAELAGLALMTLRLWLAGGILMGLGLVVIAITTGKIR